MAPKPFPFPFSIGVDICNIKRVAAILRRENVCNQWARKVFTRLEWRALCERFIEANRSEERSRENSMQDNKNIEGRDHSCLLPKLSRHSRVLDDPTLFLSTLADARSQLTILARHLAGR